MCNSRKIKGIARYKHKVAGPHAAWGAARTSASAGPKPWCRGGHAQSWGHRVGRAASGPPKVRKYDEKSGFEVEATGLGKARGGSQLD